MVNRATGGNSGTPDPLFWHKTPRIAGAAATAPIAGRWCSLWQYDGCPSGGAVPTTVAIPDNTTTGGLKQVDPGGGRQKWALSGFVANVAAGTVMMYDRLLHIGGLSGTVTTAQTVGGTITRHTDGKGNIAWAEIYTAIGATATTITMSYTDQDGNSGNTSVATTFGGTNFNTATRMIMYPVASGDSGIQAIASTTVLATTATAGNFGVTMAHPLAFYEIGAAGDAGWRDWATGLPGIPEIETDACIAYAYLPQTTTAFDGCGLLYSQEH